MAITRYRLLIFSLILLAALKYFYDFPYRAVFDFDQEYLALQAKSILADKKISLIGAPTSIGGMFIGPFYNYFAALVFYLGRMNPYALAFVNNLWSVLTLITIFLISKKLHGLRAGVFSFFLALVSFQFLNQAALPPLLFPLPLLSILIFYLLCQKKQRPFLLGILAGAGLHLHFTALFFLPMIIIFLKPLSSKTLLFLSAVFFLCLPLIIFDLRHHLFLSKNFFIFLSQRNDLQFNFLNQFWRSAVVCLENLSSLFFKDLPALLKLAFPPFFIILFFFLTPRKNLKLILVWLFLPLICFAFYKGHIINYYYVLQEPVFLMLAGFGLASLPKNLPAKIFLLIFLSFFIFFNLKNWLYWRPDPSLYYKLKALSFIKKEAGDKPFYLSFTVDPPWMGGYGYLAYYLKFNLKSKPDPLAYPTYTIIYPHFWHNIESDYVFGSIGVGVPKNE